MSAHEQYSDIPRGQVVGTYDTYLEAQRAVDFLSDKEFPVQHVSIVGSDLRMVENVLGRLTRGRAAAAGAASGAWFGLFVGVLLSAFADDGTNVSCSSCRRSPTARSSVPSSASSGTPCRAVAATSPHAARSSRARTRSGAPGPRPTGPARSWPDSRMAERPTDRCSRD